MPRLNDYVKCSLLNFDKECAIFRLGPLPGTHMDYSPPLVTHAIEKCCNLRDPSEPEGLGTKPRALLVQLTSISVWLKRPYRAKPSCPTDRLRFVTLPWNNLSEWLCSVVVKCDWQMACFCLFEVPWTWYPALFSGLCLCYYNHSENPDGPFFDKGLPAFHVYTYIHVDIVLSGLWTFWALPVSLLQTLSPQS